MTDEEVLKELRKISAAGRHAAGYALHELSEASEDEAVGDEVHRVYLLVNYLWDPTDVLFDMLTDD